jgi:dTMP kinase
MRGKFISFEGSEGAGKTTQIALLAKELLDRGLSICQTREPGGTEGAEAIRNLLLSGSDDKWNAGSEALLFAAARADHVAKLILPALDRGEWVLCDRFIDSSRAYQGSGGGLTDEDILELHRIGSDGLLPDCTIIFDLSHEEALARSQIRDGGKSDRMGSKGAVYYAHVTDRLRQIAASEPTRVRLIDASGSIEEVAKRVLYALSHLI